MEWLTTQEVAIVAHIAVLREYKNGATLELNRTQQVGRPELWDLRRWHPDANGNKAPGKGIVLNDREMDELKAVIAEW